MGRNIVRLLLQACGVALVLSGALWALQGLGIVMWPMGSFMLAQREWALYGGIAVMIGLVLVWASERLRR